MSSFRAMRVRSKSEFDRLQHLNSEKRIRYNLSFVSPRTGLRTLVGPNQGRYFKDTREEAEVALAQMLANNGRARIESVFGAGTYDTFRVDSFECYLNGDATHIYVRGGT